MSTVLVCPVSGPYWYGTHSCILKFEQQRDYRGEG
uniref:Uncharacterized protein n=1 Tax=Anguilla anguilla TaxID=7936 RepID=A0A0E9U1H2_ANGAN